MKRQYIRRAFDICLSLKGIFACVEIVGGLLACFASHRSVLNFVRLITQNELAENPRDVIANYLLHSAERFSINAQHFAALYLLGHGVIKIWLIAGLLRSKLWYYPAAMIIFSLFILYQFYLLTSRFSSWLVFITVIDAVVIVLTWHEYKYLRHARRPASSSAHRS